MGVGVRLFLSQQRMIYDEQGISYAAVLSIYVFHFFPKAVQAFRRGIEMITSAVGSDMPLPVLDFVEYATRVAEDETIVIVSLLLLRIGGSTDIVPVDG